MTITTRTQPGEWTTSTASARASRAGKKRASSGRRRLVDPTTCKREYTFAEVEFMQAMEEYKQRSGQKFPTWSEILEVLEGLGYTRQYAVA